LKRIFLVALLCTVMLASFGCAKKNAQPDTTEAPSATDTVTKGEEDTFDATAIPDSTDAPTPIATSDSTDVPTASPAPTHTATPDNFGKHTATPTIAPTPVTTATPTTAPTKPWSDDYGIELPIIEI